MIYHPTGVEYMPSGQEERLQNQRETFPYSASAIELDHFVGRNAPWHWHRELELVMVTQGEIEYHTPGGCTVIRQGEGGMVNANVLHMTCPHQECENSIHLVQLFDALVLAGLNAPMLYTEYVRPLTQHSGLELLHFGTEAPDHREILALMRQIWAQAAEEPPHWELEVRGLLLLLWRRLLNQVEQVPKQVSTAPGDADSIRVKLMLSFLESHYEEPISLREIAGAASVSERECLRCFQRSLHQTPVAFLNDYRLRQACRLLREGEGTVTEIGQRCGFHSTSYFVQAFRRQIGITPGEYRKVGGILTK